MHENVELVLIRTSSSKSSPRIAWRRSVCSCLLKVSRVAINEKRHGWRGESTWRTKSKLSFVTKGKKAADSASVYSPAISSFLGVWSQNDTMSSLWLACFIPYGESESALNGEERESQPTSFSLVNTTDGILSLWRAFFLTIVIPRHKTTHEWLLTQ